MEVRQPADKRVAAEVHTDGIRFVFAGSSVIRRESEQSCAIYLYPGINAAARARALDWIPYREARSRGSVARDPDAAEALGVQVALPPNAATPVATEVPAPP